MTHRLHQRVRVLAAAMCLAGTGAGNVCADNSESIFRNALKYTVQIRSTVPLPFDGDRKGSSLGAGFVVDASRRWIMTNAHVVARSPSRLEVAFHGQEFIDARKIYVDPFLDVALIQVGESADLGAVAEPNLDCGAPPSVGHPVGAFGHPWRLQFTGTRGIISGVTAKYRTELLQTDAPINQGNSGGPLISLNTGRIVGINTAGIRGAQNTNFAVAMKYACRILELLRGGADPSPPDLRLVYFRDVDERKELKVARNYAAGDVPGLRPGDIVKAVPGVPGPIQNETQLLHALRGRLDAAAITVRRAGQDVLIEEKLQPVPRMLERRGVYASGVLIGHTTIRDAGEIRGPGLMVHHVEPGSIGQAMEVERSDMLEAVDGVAIGTIDELHQKLLEARDEKRRVTLTFKKVTGGETLFSYTQRALPIRDLRIVGENARP